MHVKKKISSVVLTLMTFKTGPKGVLEDFRRYKQLETQQKEEQEQELKALIKKFSTGCQTSVSRICKKLVKNMKDNNDECVRAVAMRIMSMMMEVMSATGPTVY